MVDTRTEAEKEADRLIDAAERAIGEQAIDELISDSRYEDMVDNALTSTQEEFRKRVGEKLYDPVLIQLIFAELTDEEIEELHKLDSKYTKGALFAGLTGRAAKDDDPRNSMDPDEFIEHIKKKFGFTEDEEELIDKLKSVYEDVKDNVPDELRESTRVE